MSQQIATKAYTARQVAEYFIHLANSDFVDNGGEDDSNPDEMAEGITNLKLQKILYFAQANYLANFGRPLFDDDIEAWQYGPVVSGIYHAFKHFGSGPIDQGEIDSDFSKIANEDQSQMQMLWDTYGRYSALFLFQSSHSHQPWKDAFTNKERKVITKESMKSFYGPPSS